MTRTFSEMKSKRVSGQKQRRDTDSKSIKEDSTITQTHPVTPNLPKKKQKIRAYATVLSKPAYICDFPGKPTCIRDYERKTRV